MLTHISTIPRIFLNMLSCILASMHIAADDITRNIERMGMSLFHVIILRYFHAAIRDVVKASRPERAVASPYDGIRNGSIVIMNIPNPKPVVLCTKLAPKASRNISTMLSISDQFRYLLKPEGISFIKCVKLGTVDVKNGNCFAVFEYRYDNLAA